MESLGGAHTPAVGWAAGIERLAMLIAEPVAERIDVYVVVENDAVQADGILAVSTLRRAGLAAELLATGSPRKRFDKASKSNPRMLLSLGHADGRTSARLKVVDGEGAAVERALAGIAWPGDALVA
jgi:histidyl-tRNA synthetase